MTEIQLGYGFEPDEHIVKYYFSKFCIYNYLIITNHRLIFSNQPKFDIVDVSYCGWGAIEFARIETVGETYVLVIYFRGKGQRKTRDFRFSFHKKVTKGLIFQSTEIQYDHSKYNLLVEIRDYIMNKVEELKQPKIEVYTWTNVTDMPHRTPISNKLKHQVWRRDNFTCQYCGKTINEVELEVDHIMPVSKGGKTVISNLQTLCVQCNREKSNK